MTRISFLGAGNICQAIVGGLIEGGYAPELLTVTDKMDLHFPHFEGLGIHCTHDNMAAAAAADVIVLCVKPDVVKVVAAEIGPSLNQQLIISVAAGVNTASLKSWLKTPVPIIRCMPNTPALVMTGMTGLFATSSVSPVEQETAQTIMAAVGKYLWFDEERSLDAVTAISGSGPAYFFYMAEIMNQAAENLGLTPSDARQLVNQTMLGAARMLGDGEDAAVLRRRVTSPGGTTAAALTVIMESGTDQIMSRATSAAFNRSIELAGD